MYLAFVSGFLPQSFTPPRIPCVMSVFTVLMG